MKALHFPMTRIAIRFVSFVAIALPLCAPGVSQEKNQVQTRPAQQEPPAVLKVTTRLITVDVVARDRRGNPIRDLQAGDFQVAEQGRSGKAQQQIASFRLLDRVLAKVADPERVSLQLPAGVYTNLVTTKSLSAPPTILLVDGLNTDAKTQLQVRQKMVRLLASAPSDVPMAVFLLGRNLSLLQSFTTDAKLLRAAAERALTLEATNLQAKDARDDPFSHSSLLEQMAGAEGQSDIPGGPPAPQPGSQGSTGGGNSNALLAMRALQLQRFEREQYASSMDIRVKLTLDALRVIARHVSGYPGRKNLIWLSSAFPLAITPDANLTMVAKFSGIRNYSDDMTAVASALTDAQIAVYPVDPRGMETQALFDPESRGRLNPFSEGATLNRESNVRFSSQESMQDLAEQTGGKVCLNNNDLSECVKRAIDDSSSYYELTYYPTDKDWRGEFRKISVKTTRPGVQLSYREGYFARESDATVAAKDAKDTDTHLSQAACNDFLTATTILLEATALPPDEPGQTKYFMVIDPNALSFGAPEGGVRNLQMELATCMFNKRGLPLQYNRQTIHQKFTEAEYEFSRKHGISHSISFVPKPGTARVRVLVCDTRTGMIGSVELPHPAQIISTAKPEAGGGEPAQASSQASTTSPASPRLIKFRGKDGRAGILEWNAERISYSGDMEPEASAKALYDSLWGKSYGCESGKLLSLSDTSTPAPQPLHFKFDDTHGTDVYLDAQDGVRYSGSLSVDSSVKPFFEAVRSLYQCKNPAATINPK
ncbi:MAG TPA: VWA domain-containing protein [Candidatus Polarisedimenticolia bacterium]|nr:VWA domain-containing protein [Candidatus Polarisedimenticolia bacterium]